MFVYVDGVFEVMFILGEVFFIICVFNIELNDIIGYFEFVYFVVDIFDIFV